METHGDRVCSFDLLQEQGSDRKIELLNKSEEGSHKRSNTNVNGSYSKSNRIIHSAIKRERSSSVNARTANRINLPARNELIDSKEILQ